MSNNLNVYSKLLNIQNQLKAPKNQYNNFGKYNYRNCEDILEAVKPLLKNNKAIVMLTDVVEIVGTRHYIKSEAKFIDVETAESISTFAYAREEEVKKGMDGSQITGSSSSYARKYALNGLFAIDDAKDSDSTNTDNDNIFEISEKQIKRLFAIANEKCINADNVKFICERKYKCDVKSLKKVDYEQFCIELNENSEQIKKWLESQKTKLNK